MGIIADLLGPFHPRRMVSLIRTRGRGSKRQQQIERDAAADVAAVEQDDKYFSPDAPANEDELLSFWLGSMANLMASRSAKGRAQDQPS